MTEIEKAGKMPVDQFYLSLSWLMGLEIVYGFTVQ